MTGLHAFVDDETQAGYAADAPLQTLPIIMFSFAGDGFILAAEQAVATIPMVAVTRLPGAHPGFAGAIQDRGRVIGLLAHPLALVGKFAAGVRVILCRGPRGLLGLPVSVLDGLSELHASHTPAHAALVEHERRAYTFVDARALGNLLSG